MKQVKRYTIIGILFVLITGTLSHFLYDWSGANSIVGLFSPVNESIWEHMKLLFFPMLLYLPVMIFKFRELRSCIVSAFCFGILTGTLLIPISYYGYHAVLDKDIFILDISIFILSILVAFWLSYRFSISCALKSYTLLFVGLVVIFFLCFIVFTCYPPDFSLFEDPSRHSDNQSSIMARNLPAASVNPLKSTTAKSVVSTGMISPPASKGSRL